MTKGLHKLFTSLLNLTLALALMLMAVPMQSAQALGGGSGSIGLTTLGSAYTRNFDLCL